MKSFRLLMLASALLVLPWTAAAQVPQIISYQGRVTASGTNFDGLGQFKFALVSGGAKASDQATASGTLMYGFLVHITVISPGAGYTAPPAVTITDPTGAGAAAYAQVANGQVTAIVMQDAGYNYTAPVITIAPPPDAFRHTTYWSNDGASSAGGEPGLAVPLPVAQGLFMVLLGDTTLSNMLAIPALVFTNSDVRLRIWFGDGAGGFQQLAPDQRIAAVGYALVANTVPDGSITAAKLADASIPLTKLEPAVQRELTPPPGIIALSDDPASTNLLASGYTRLPAAKVMTEEFEVVPFTNSVPIGDSASSVYTGTEIILWGGWGSGGTNIGGRYNIASNRWIATTLNNAPVGRSGHSAVWTGREMLVWGGYQSSNGVEYYLNSGGRYNPVSNRWVSMSTSNAPSPRSGHSAVWSGTEMLVWGGGVWDSETGVQYFNTGARYHPESNAWTPISTTDAPSSRVRAFTAWTGSEMLVWGGSTLAGQTNDGALYDPTSDTWRPMNTAGAPYGYRGIVWTGTQMLLLDDAGSARYDLASDSWQPVANTGSLPDFGDNQAFWTGTEAVLTKFTSDHVILARYQSSLDRWMRTEGPTYLGSDSDWQVWTGTEALFLRRDTLAAHKWRPSKPLYLYQKQ